MQFHRRRRPRYLRRLLVLALLLVLAAGAAVRFSPWPAALILRQVHEAEAARAMAALTPLVPAGLAERRDVNYLGAGPETRMDLILPPGPAPATGWPVVVWLHGGAWVAGDKADVGNYARLLAGQGVAVVAVNTPRAPAARHPEPARHAHAALAWLAAHGPGAGLDMAQVVLAGNGTGAQIAAQAGLAQVDAGYADRLALRPALPPGALRGLVLFGGVYDPGALVLPVPLGRLRARVAEAYFGPGGPTATDLALYDIAGNLPADLPPLFVSAGPADPRAPQSAALAEAAEAKGLRADSLFFAAEAAVPHYPFDLTAPAGRAGFDRMLAFLNGVFSRPAAP